MKRAETKRLMAERAALISLLDLADCDLHGWSSENSAQARYRVDGRLYEFERPHFEVLRRLAAVQQEGRA